MNIQIQTILFAIVVIYILYTLSKSKELKVSCTVLQDDPTCTMYNHRDINSKCSAMCKLKYPDSSYNNTHTFENNTHTCDCVNKENFTSLQNFDTPILGTQVTDDSLFSNRNYVEKQEYNRLNSLIFG
jgi:hypothetical protein